MRATSCVVTTVSAVCPARGPPIRRRLPCCLSGVASAFEPAERVDTAQPACGVSCGGSRDKDPTIIVVLLLLTTTDHLRRRWPSWQNWRCRQHASEAGGRPDGVTDRKPDGPGRLIQPVGVSEEGGSGRLDGKPCHGPGNKEKGKLQSVGPERRALHPPRSTIRLRGVKIRSRPCTPRIVRAFTANADG